MRRLFMLWRLGGAGSASLANGAASARPSTLAHTSFAALGLFCTRVAQFRLSPDRGRRRFRIVAATIAWAGKTGSADDPN